jgi:hypothetical protein
VCVAVFGDAFVELVDYGSVFPYTFPINFEGLQGSSPVFDFVFPVVFSQQVNGRSATATLEFTGDADTAVAVLADASVAITSDAIRIDPTIFTFFLPAQFIS